MKTNIIAFTWVILLVQTSDAQWSHSGDYRGDVISLTVHQDKVFATASKDVYPIAPSSAVAGLGVVFLDSDGINLNSLNIGLPGLRVSCIFSNGPKLFTVALDPTAGLYEYNPDAAQWQEKDIPLASGQSFIWSIASSAGIVCAGKKINNINQGGVLISMDNGISWNQKTNSGLSTTDVRSVLIHSNTLFAGTWTGGMFKSSVEIDSEWHAVDFGQFQPQIIRALAHSNGIIFAGSEAGLFISQNNGTTWSQLLGGNGITAIATTEESIVIAGTSSGRVFVSCDNGGNWSDITENLPSENSGFSNYITSLAILGNSLFAGIVDNGIVTRQIRNTFYSDCNGDGVADNPGDIPELSCSTDAPITCGHPMVLCPGTHVNFIFIVDNCNGRRRLSPVGWIIASIMTGSLLAFLAFRKKKWPR